MNATKTQLQTIRFADLPAFGAELEGGEFAGIHTKPDGTHWAVSKLPGVGSKLTHKLAITDAKERSGELPTKAVAALVVANLTVEPGWYWTCEVHKDDASYAWNFNSNGNTNNNNRSAAGGALAVRRFSPDQPAGTGLPRLPTHEAQQRQCVGFRGSRRTKHLPTRRRTGISVRWRPHR